MSPGRTRQKLSRKDEQISGGTVAACLLSISVKPSDLGEQHVITPVPLLSKDRIRQLPERAREVVEYRKSGLSLNHIQGCSLGCAYCIRHTYGLWEQDQPRALMTDAKAVDELVNHSYFQPHVRRVQLFNRATEPFLPKVRPHTFAVLEDLDE